MFGFFKRKQQPCLTCQLEEKRRIWVKEILSTSKWLPITAEEGTFETLKKQVAYYNRIAGEDGWKDFQYRLSQLREATKQAIERGGLDKWGNSHTEEQRAVLFLLDNLLTYVPAIKEQHDQIVASLQADEAKAGQPLYGMDRIQSLTSEF